jgi:integrase
MSDRLDDRGRGMQPSASMPALTELDEPHVGEDVALAVVRSALSHVLCDSRCKLASPVDQLNDMLLRYGAVGIKRSPAPFGGATPARGRKATTVMSRRKLARPDLDALWADAIQTGETLPAVNEELLREFFPEASWQVAAAVLSDGPAIAAARLERALALEARRVLPPTRARPNGGRPSRARLLSLAAGIRRLMAVYCELRVLSDAACLQPWLSVPAPPRIAAEAATTDRSSPPRHVLRAAWTTAENDVLRRLRCTAEQEPAVLATMCIDRMEDAGLFRATRNRALLLLLALSGGREAAIRALRVQDIRLDHPSPDGRVGPAIGLRPGKKSAGPDEFRWKPIPQPAADRIVSYITVCERLSGSPRSGDEPLFVGNPRTGRELTHGSLYGIFAGRPGSDDRPPQPGLVRQIESADGDTGWQGYSPQRLRRAASQLTLHGAREAWREGHLEIDPETLADQLLDHQISKDRLGYFDLNSREARERWSGVATAINWEMLTTDRGARHAIDAAAYGRALREQRALEHALKELRGRLDALLQPGVSKAASPLEELQRLATNQLQAHAAIREERRIESLLRERTAEIERLLHDRSRRIPIADDAPPGAEVVDLEAVERAALEGRTRREHESPWVRDWISVAELAAIQGVGEATARRWVAGALPFPDGDPRNPWPHDEVPIAPGSTARRRRLLVSGIDPKFFDSAAKRDALELVLRNWPPGWTPEAPTG